MIQRTDAGRAATAMPADSFERQYRLEEQRFAESARQGRVMLLALVPLGAVMAMVIQYLSIQDQLDQADYYYVLDRVDTGVYLRLVVPALLGGMMAAAGVTALFTFLSDAGQSAWRLLTIGLFYGIAAPAIAGFLMPLNLFILSVLGLSNVTNQGSVGDQIGDLLFSTPGFTYLSIIFGIGPGIISGFIMAGIAWVIFRVAGPLSNARRAWSIYAASLVVGVAIMAFVTAGPFSITEFLFNWYANQ